jgi:predicted nucleotidyltransferase
MSLTLDLLPADDATVHRDVRDFAALVREVYGDRLVGIYLFGSRARGDHRPESDADVAVVFRDSPLDYWAEKSRLTELTYDFLVDDGAQIQAWPVTKEQWEHPESHANPSLLRAMKRDGQRVAA